MPMSIYKERYGIPYSRLHVINFTSLVLAINRATASIGVTSGDVESGVADCDPQNILNPRRNCGSFVDATSSKS